MYIKQHYQKKEKIKKSGYPIGKSEQILDRYNQVESVILGIENSEVKEAIEEARQRQQSRMAVINSQRSRDAMFASQRTRPGLRVSGGQGGFVSTERGLGNRWEQSQIRGSANQSDASSSIGSSSAMNSNQRNLKNQQPNSRSESGSSTDASSQSNAGL